MRKCDLMIVVMAAAILNSCGGTSRPERNANDGSGISDTETPARYEDAYRAASSELAEEDNEYIDNSLKTGAVPYRNGSCPGSGSTIGVKTSSGSECDIVVIVKHHGTIVRNAYIAAGDSYQFSVPNGDYQVFFYGGKGWNPDKQKGNGCVGGFVANESYSKDSEVSLYNQGLEYELILQRNGNFSTQPSSEGEMF